MCFFLDGLSQPLEATIFGVRLFLRQLAWTTPARSILIITLTFFWFQ
jgi:hypothetical protein